MAVKTSSREHRVPTGYKEIKRDDALGIQVFSSPDLLCVMGFSGRSQKASFYIRFKSVERAKAYVTEWEAQQRGRKAAQDAIRAERKGPHSLTVGDVLSSSWGYEQTNVDFYQVVELVGKRTVVLREISKMAAEVGRSSMQGECVPAVGQFTGEPFRKQADSHNRIKISSFQSASPLEFKEVCGVRIYKRSSYTTYA